MKKSSFIFIFLCLLLNIKVFALEPSNKTNVENDKVWLITFNKDIKSFNKNLIKVLDENNIEVKTDISINDNKSISIKSLNKYIAGKTYTLSIDKKFNPNEELENDFNFKFTIKNHTFNDYEILCVDKNKTWEIVFKDKIHDLETLKKNIEVFQKDGIKIDTIIEKLDENTIKLHSPKDDYIPGEDYVLWFDSTISHIDGIKVDTLKNLKFVIKDTIDYSMFSVNKDIIDSSYGNDKLLLINEKNIFSYTNSILKHLYGTFESDTYEKISFINGIFYVLGYDNQKEEGLILTSQDGMQWNRELIGEKITLEKIIIQDKRTIYLGHDNSNYNSKVIIKDHETNTSKIHDIKLDTDEISIENPKIHDIIWAKNKFYAVLRIYYYKNGISKYYILNSDDGTVWKPVFELNYDFTYQLKFIETNNSLFLIDRHNSVIYQSQNGLDWTLNENIFPNISYSDQIKKQLEYFNIDKKYDNFIMYANPQKTSYSTLNMNVESYNIINDQYIAILSNRSKTKVSGSFYKMDADYIWNYFVLFSNDGVTWEVKGFFTGFYNHSSYDTTHFIDNKLYIPFNQIMIEIDNDNIKEAPFKKAEINKLYYLDNEFILYTNTGEIYTSKTGYKWSLIKKYSFPNILNFLHTEDKFYGSSQDLGEVYIYESTNLKDWNRIHHLKEISIYNDYRKDPALSYNETYNTKIKVTSLSSMFWDGEYFYLDLAGIIISNNRTESTLCKTKDFKTFELIYTSYRTYFHKGFNRKIYDYYITLTKDNKFVGSGLYGLLYISDDLVDLDILTEARELVEYNTHGEPHDLFKTYLTKDNYITPVRFEKRVIITQNFKDIDIIDVDAPSEFDYGSVVKANDETFIFSDLSEENFINLYFSNDLLEWKHIIKINKLSKNNNPYNLNPIVKMTDNKLLYYQNSLWVIDLNTQK